MNIPPRPFKLSVIACAICYANLTYAQDAQVQALQTIQVKASNAEQSSEQTKAYNVKNSSSATKLNIEAKETPQTINVTSLGFFVVRQTVGISPVFKAFMGRPLF